MNNEAGFVIITGMIVLTILLIIVIGLTSIISNEIHISSYEENSIRAFYTAEAGIEYAITVVNDQVWDESDGLSEEKVNNISSIIEGGELNEVTMIKSGNEVTITSIGSYRGITSTLEFVYITE